MKPRHPAPLHALHAFEAAARRLSFQDAAAELFVTPAAISQQVKRLEQYLGVKLFRRAHRAVHLTREGETLAASLGEVFARLDRALDQVGAVSATTLRVSTMESFAAKWLAPRLHRFQQACSGIDLHLDTGDVLTDFSRSDIDLAIRYGPGGYTDVHAERLLDATVFPVCAPSLRGGDPALRDPADLSRHTLLHDESARARPGVPDWAAWLAAVGESRVDAGRGPVFASIYLAQEAAIAGQGVALGVAPLVEQDLQDGRLVRPFDHALPNAYAFWIVRRDATPTSPAAATFCQWLHAEAAGATRTD